MHRGGRGGRCEEKRNTKPRTSDGIKSLKVYDTRTLISLLVTEKYAENRIIKLSKEKTAVEGEKRKEREK